MRASEIDFHCPALIPETYIADAHHRLVEYKRISSAIDKNGLKEMQIELIDRFGLMPDSLKQLFRVTEIKMQTAQLGIEKIDVGEQSGKLIFNSKPDIDPMKIISLIQSEPQTYRFDGKQTLRFECQDVELEARFTQVEKLLCYFSEATI